MADPDPPRPPIPAKQSQPVQRLHKRPNVPRAPFLPDEEEEGALAKHGLLPIEESEKDAGRG